MTNKRYEGGLDRGWVWDPLGSYGSILDGLVLKEGLIV
jgi:hypothetical protein